MKNMLASLPIIVVGVLLVFVLNFVYIVNETQQVVITEFGKPKDKPVTTPGIHFKVPFIQEINYFEKRYLEWDGDRNQVPTKDKKFIFVDTYARWQITDPLLFFKRFRDERGAQSRLDDILDGETRNAVANNNLDELIRTSNREAIKVEDYNSVETELVKINVGREKIQEQILLTANTRTKDLGIEILDFRFKRINYVEEVRVKVYDRMKSERNRIADKFKSEGEGEFSRISGEKDRELKRIQSEAFKTAEEIMGKADAEAAAIFSQSYNKSNQSRELYSFVKSMETLEKTFDSKTSVLLSTNSELYKYLVNIK